MATEHGDDYWALRERYWRALGRFVDEFAEIEKLLYILLMLETQVDHATAAATLRRPSVKKILDGIKAARSDSGAANNKLFARGLEGFNVIKARRDAVLHRSTEAARDGSLWVTDALWSTEPQPFKISPEDLEDMTRDLPTIKACFVAYMLTDLIYRIGGHEGDALSILSRHQVALGFAQQAAIPWHYEGLLIRLG